MNSLFIGADRTEILSRLTPPYLLIDDGPFIDRLPKRRVFNTTKHSLNILKDMDYRKARNFLHVLDAAFPEGENTLTRKNSNFLILKALLDNPKSLSNMIVPDKEPASVDAYQKIHTLLLSPVLSRVLARDTNFNFDDVVLARLDRSVIGDFDAFVIAHFLISHYQHQVVIPDFGFYGRDYLTYLIRQDRLIAGVQTLSQLSPKLRQEVLLIEDKEGRGCTYDDAVVLTNYKGISPNAREYREQIAELVGGNA